MEQQFVTRVAILTEDSAGARTLEALLSPSRLIDCYGTAFTLGGALLFDPDVLLLFPPPKMGRLLAEVEAASRSLPPVLVATDEPSDIEEISDLPIWGVISATTGMEELECALHSLHHGLIVATPILLKTLFSESSRRVSDPRDIKGDLSADIITHRESEVFQLLARGMANKEIAGSLGISEHTVKFHISSIFAKLEVSNRTEALREGIQRGMLTL
jgi:DNA-binding NarL/FixJ family response regulator